MMVVNNDGDSEIAFSTMQTGLDLEYGQSIVFFSWSGPEELDEVNGSGSAELLADGTLEIEFVYHLGDEATLKAVHEPSSTTC